MKQRGGKIALMGIAALAAISTVVMLLWNWLVCGIFGLTTINFWQAVGLFLLARILFGRFGFGRDRMMHERGNHMREKWMKMTPEQRKEFINRRRHFGFGHPLDMEHFDKGAQAQQGDGNE
ncbi:MAG: hypothetical protein QM727_08880 [Niabella sp.]